jgi:hypothetical protein
MGGVMKLGDIRYATTSQLRREITRCNKALVGTRTYPNAMSRLVAEDINRLLEYIHAELEKRR